jgi:pimeloyl-ACP methyl ester carboxylesterase
MQTIERAVGPNKLILPDGRGLAFAEYGDPAGKAVIFMHGFPDSRLTRNPDDTLTASLGVRLIIPDRPGIGASDFKPARALVERVDDMAALADHLGLDRFAVLGWSAGGPYALACASQMPERLTAVGVACGFAPFDRPDALAGMTKEMQQAIPLMRRWPWLTRLVTASLPGQYRKDPEAAFQKQFSTALSPADAQVMAEPAVRANLMQGAVEAMRQGARGPAMEMELLFGRPWGFQPSSISHPVSMWYGDADALVPLPMGRYLAQILPRAHLTVCPGQGHMLYVPRWAEMLRAMAA